MFTAIGFTEGVPYRVTVGDNGTVTGSERVQMLLERRKGEQFAASPTHGSVALSDDPASILIALKALTTVSATSGEVPDIMATDEIDVPAGTVF